ncbi:hypothetical protein ACA910_007222 [Epithemia clementina (nom. ined.)]
MMPFDDDDHVVVENDSSRNTTLSTTSNNDSGNSQVTLLSLLNNSNDTREQQEQQQEHRQQYSVAQRTDEIYPVASDDKSNQTFTAGPEATIVSRPQAIIKDLVQVVQDAMRRPLVDPPPVLQQEGRTRTRARSLPRNAFRPSYCCEDSSSFGEEEFSP